MFKFFRRNRKSNKTNESLNQLNEALYPSKINVVYEDITTYTRRGEKFMIGDKVICRSNECDPLWVGEIVEFWDNDGKWAEPMPQVKKENGEIYGVMGIMKHYSEELMETLKPLKPLEQWNYFVDDIHKYSEEEIERKEKSYQKMLNNIK